MNPPTIWERIKEMIAGISFSIFIWASGYKDTEQYIDIIYNEEKAIREQ